jgi:dipeptidyl aminopeptidase/acylaminoacyl peptidase
MPERTPSIGIMLEPSITATPTLDGMLLYKIWSEISVYNLGTAKTVSLVKNLKNIHRYSLSQDGRMLVYLLKAPMESHDYLVDLETRQIRSIPPFDPPLIAWHPSDDGFIGYLPKTGNADFFRLTDGAIVSTFGEASGYDWVKNPKVFSPNGKKMALFCGKNAMCIFDVFLDAKGQVSGMGSTPQQIQLSANIYPVLDSIQWSPAGNQLAFTVSNTRCNCDGGHLLVVNMESGEWFDYSELTSERNKGNRNSDSLNYVSNFHWSPDGTKIAFTAQAYVNDAGGWTPQVFVMNSDATGLFMITGDADYLIGEDPIWTPDGRLIFRSDDKANKLVISNIDGTGKLVLIDDAEFYNYYFLPAQAQEYLAGVLAEPFLFTCATGWTRIGAGGQARVVGKEGDTPNRVRSEPQNGDNMVAQLLPGTIVNVLEGPVCTEDFIFWKVKSSSIPGGTGWTAEGDGTDYWLEPYNL